MREFYQHKIPSILNIQKIVTIHFFEFPAQYRFKGESHDFWELVYCDRNDVLISQDGKEMPLNCGELTVHPPNVFHSIASNGKNCSVFVLSFVSNSKVLYALNKGNTKYMLDDIEKHYISEILSEADKTFDLPTFHTKHKKLELLPRPVFGGLQMIKITAEMLLLNLLRRLQSVTRIPERPVGIQVKSRETVVEAVKEYLARNVYNKVNLTEIAYFFNYGKTFLCTKFKEDTGLTIFEYFTQLKIKEAKELIRKNTYTFSQISDMLNFNSPSHFSYVFKKNVKVSLSQYKDGIKS